MDGKPVRKWQIMQAADVTDAEWAYGAEGEWNKRGIDPMWYGRRHPDGSTDGYQFVQRGDQLLCYKDFIGDFETEPFECGRASEAILFVRVEEVSGTDAVLRAKAQIPADGVTWADEGTEFGPITARSLNFIRLTHLGGWLRLACTISGADARFRLLLNVALKE